MKLKMILQTFVIWAVIIYLIMFVSTTPVVYHVKNIMLGNVERTVTDGMPLSQYNNSDIFVVGISC